MKSVLAALAVLLASHTAHAQATKVDLTWAWEGVITEAAEVLLQPAYNGKKVGEVAEGETVTVYSSVGLYHGIAADGRHIGYIVSHAVERAGKKRRESAAAPPVSTAPPPAAAAPAPVVRAEPEQAPSAARTVGPIRVPQKNPSTATLLSVVVVGGGQFYAGDVGKGTVLLLGAVAATTAGYVISANSAEVSCVSATFGCREKRNLLPLWIGAATGTALWVTGIAGANDAVHRFNDRQMARHLGVGTVQDIDGSTRPALAYRVTF